MAEIDHGGAMLADLYVGVASAILQPGKTMPIMQPPHERGRPSGAVRVTEMPWAMLDSQCEEWSQRNHEQSLDRVRERGGFNASEMLAVMLGIRWRPMDDEVAHRTLYLMRVYWRRGALYGSDRPRAVVAPATVTPRVVGDPMAVVERMRWNGDDTDPAREGYETAISDLREALRAYSEDAA